jgi:hypothetical protein
MNLNTGQKKKVANFFIEPTWNVEENKIFLDNRIEEPFNSGEATLITKLERFGHFDPEREETYLIEDGHYPIAGDQYLDEQMEEIEEEEA